MSELDHKKLHLCISDSLLLTDRTERVEMRHQDSRVEQREGETRVIRCRPFVPGWFFPVTDTPVHTIWGHMYFNRWGGHTKEVHQRVKARKCLQDRNVLKMCLQGKRKLENLKISSLLLTSVLWGINKDKGEYPKKGQKLIIIASFITLKKILYKTIKVKEVSFSCHL